MRLLLIAATCGILTAQTAPAVEQGFDHFYNLEYDQAVSIFQRLAKENPKNAHYHNHLAQSILYREMLRAGALETELVTGGNAFLRRAKMNPSAADQKTFDEAIANSMALSQAVLDRNPDDKEALYTIGIAYGLRANYNFLVRKAWMDSLRDATASRKAHNHITDLDGSAIDARMVQGIHDYIIGSLPWHYKMLGFLVGFRGDKDTGIATLEKVRREGVRNTHDAAILLATIYRREKQPAKAVPLLDALISRFPRNYLLGLELAQMHSDLGNKDKALAAIAEVEKRKLAGSPGYAALPMEKVLYFRGTVQFWYGDLDGALTNFQQVTAKADALDPNTGVTAWLRLGQTHDLKGNRNGAMAAYRKAIAYAPDSDAAKRSEQYLRAPYRRNREG